MATTTATPSRSTATSGTRSVFPLVAFFVLAYALSWLILVPAGLGLLPDSGAVDPYGGGRGGGGADHRLYQGTSRLRAQACSATGSQASHGRACRLTSRESIPRASY